MTSYVVSVASPTPCWVTWDENTRFPRFTFIQPEGTSLEAAQALMKRAEIFLTFASLSVVAADG